MRLWLVALAVALIACTPPGSEPGARASAQDRPSEQRRAPHDARAQERARLVGVLAAQGIRDRRVLAAMRRVPRHEFVPAELRGEAYDDRPLPIGHDQTISQPHIVALMTELADVAPPCRVLEVGTGSGYQAAVLAQVGCEVFTIEIVEPLASESRARLERLGYGRWIHVRAGDGYRGWPDEAPFDAIVITAAPPEIPEPLPAQLRVGGVLVAPVGETFATQELVVITRTGESSFDRRTATLVRFVPMTGEAQRRRE